MLRRYHHGLYAPNSPDSPPPGIADVSSPAQPQSAPPAGSTSTTPTAAAQFSDDFKPASVAASVLVQRRPGRAFLEISNSADATGTLYLFPTPTNQAKGSHVSGKGIPVPPGYTWTPPGPWEGAVVGVWTGGAGVGGAYIAEYLYA